MSAQNYRSNLIWLAVAIAIAGLALRFGLGTRWFGFYGPATLALIATLWLTVIIFQRYPAMGLRRWPTLIVILPIIAISLVQIGFWAAYFNTGPQGIGLGLGRTMAIGYIDAALPFLVATLSAAMIWLAYRGARQSDTSTAS